MDTGLLTVLVAGCAALAVVLAAVLIGVLRHGRRTRASLDTARADLEALRARVEALQRTDGPAGVPGERASVSEEFVITTLPDGSERSAVAVPESDAMVPHLTAGQFASVALGESLVRIVSVGYGVRRALTAENRNRIRFEMRRTVRHARKHRRRSEREAKRHLRSEQGSQAA